jgi:hypothetical protein
MRGLMFLFVVFAGAGVLIGTLGVPLWRRKVSPNHIYGLRVPVTLSNPGRVGNAGRLSRSVPIISAGEADGSTGRGNE